MILYNICSDNYRGMPVLCKYKVFRFKPYINLLMMVVVPYIFELALHFVPTYENNTIIHDLFSCLIGIKNSKCWSL